MATNLKDLATRLGVSTMTVSRALRGCRGVGTEVRDRVLAVAREMDYCPERNHAARTLQRQAKDQGPLPNRVACIMIGHDDAQDAQSFHGAILEGIRGVCCEVHFDLVIADHYEANLPLVVLRGQVDGVITLLPQEDPRQRWLPFPMPRISLLAEVPEADAVVVDNVLAGRELGRHLAALGHRRVAFIGPAFELAQQRLAGLRAGLAEGQAEAPDALVLLRPDAGNEASVAALMAELTQCTGGVPHLAEACSALVGYNDFMAAHAIRWLADRGVSVPQQLSAAGFDGALPMDLRGLRLTTVALPLRQLGAEAMRLLSLRLQALNEPSRKLLLKATFIAGETTAAPPIAQS